MARRLDTIVVLVSIFSLFSTPAFGLVAIDSLGWKSEVSFDSSKIPLAKIHTWKLEIKDQNNQLVPCSPNSVTGDMPAHRHGLPTRPVARATEKPGVIWVEGLKFQMPGEWEVLISCTDTVGNNHEFKFTFVL
ncbi:FixH family protein [Vibrio sp. WXL210]|uniref:FixH family protein n=1 Tax=Vibrio sp. WXL210 TaxID=3450709 RepID=UPI003EC65BFA